MSDATKVEALREVLLAFNQHDLDSIMSHFAEDCVFESPRGPDMWGHRFVGKEEVGRGLAARFEGIPDVHYGGDEHFACGNRGVSEWTISGTTVGARASRYVGATSGPSTRTGRSFAKTRSGRFGSRPRGRFSARPGHLRAPSPPVRSRGPGSPTRWSRRP